LIHRGAQRTPLGEFRINLVVLFVYAVMTGPNFSPLRPENAEPESLELEKCVLRAPAVEKSGTVDRRSQV
jgi:hypothetical protein